MKKNIILIFFIFFVATFSFHITPTFFEKRIDGGGEYQEFTLKNSTDRTVRYKISFLPGLGKFENMSEWIEFSPKVLTIKPQSESTLKVYIKAPKGAKEGEYSALLNAKTITVPKIDRAPYEKVEAAAAIGLDISLEIVSYVGELNPDLLVTNLKIIEDKDGKAILTFNIKNNTPKRGVYYSIEVIQSNDNFETFENGRIGFGQSEDIKITLNNTKKREIVGIRIRETSTRKEITSKKL